MPLVAFILLAPQTARLTPTDDIWVYAHASDPSHDVNLRIWGTSGHAAPVDAADAEDASMALLRWDLAGLPAGKKLTKATLVLTNIPNPGFTLEQAKATPLEARPVGAGFDEKTWDFDKVGKFLPPGDAKAIFGAAWPSAIEPDKPLKLEIDLLKGPGGFAKYFDAALGGADKHLAIALTSAIDMASLGRTAMFKIYSRDEKDETLRPSLVLVFE